MKKQNQPTRRVVIVGTDSLLDEGIKKLLAHEPDLEVSSIAYTDEATFLQDVSQAHPDVILLNEASPLDSARIFALLKNIEIPIPATLRVIVVRADDNAIDVYQKQHVIATRRDDLFTFIRGGDARV